MPTATQQKLTDRFCPTGSVRPIMESAGDGKEPLDPSVYLGRAIGEFFVIDGRSANNRIYRRDLWEKAIESVGVALKNGGLAGTFGHDRPLDEDTYCDGRISHKVSRLWIEGNVGMGEMLILNTKAGHALNTYLRAGLPVAVSSRAMGSFLLGERGPNGEDIVDPETYVLETFDMVLNPGVASAYPKMVESLHKVEEERKMPDEHKLYEQVAQLSVESKSLNEKLLAAQLENQKSLAALDESKKMNESLQKQVSFYRKYVGSPADVQSIAESLRKWAELEPWKDLAKQTSLFNQNGLDMKTVVNKLFTVAEKTIPAGSLKRANENAQLVKNYSKLGSVSEINAALDVLDSYTKIGKVEELKNLARLGKEYKKLGSIAELNRCLNILEQYGKLGKLSEIKQIFKVTEAYVRLGNPKQLIERLKKAAVSEKAAKQAEIKNKAKAISEKFEGVAPASVEKLLGRMSEADAEATLKALAETSNTTDRFKITEASKDGKVVSMPIEGGAKSIAEAMFKRIPRSTRTVQDGRR